MTKVRLLVILLVMIVLSDYSAHAQFRVGAYGCYGISSIINQEDDDIPDISGKGALCYGIEASYGFTNFFNIQTGLMFGNSRFMVETTTTSGIKTTLNLECTTISIPLLAGMHVFERLAVNAGPVFAFQTNVFDIPYIDKQSGVAVYLGMEYSHPYKRIHIKLSPYFMKYAVVPFESKDNLRQALNVGLKVGFDLGL